MKENMESKQEKILILTTLDNSKQLLAKLVLNRDYTENIATDNEVNNDNVEIIETNQYSISHCIGCNRCWIKTPGICCIHDDYEMIFKKILAANKVIFVTEEKLGFVSYQLKNIIDRLIAIDMPYTTIKNGQARHVARYPKSWKFMLLFPECKNLKYLNEWLERVAINFHSESLGAYQFGNKEGIKNALYNH